jgi:hypothetical protein
MRCVVKEVSAKGHQQVPCGTRMHRFRWKMNVILEFIRQSEAS